MRARERQSKMWDDGDDTNKRALSSSLFSFPRAAAFRPRCVPTISLPSFLRRLCTLRCTTTETACIFNTRCIRDARLSAVGPIIRNDRIHNKGRRGDNPSHARRAPCRCRSAPRDSANAKFWQLRKKFDHPSKRCNTNLPLFLLTFRDKIF